MDEALICECGEGRFWVLKDRYRCPRCFNEYRIHGSGPSVFRRFHFGKKGYLDNWEPAVVGLSALPDHPSTELLNGSRRSCS